MRIALLILLGLAIGMVGTINVMNTLRARNPMPEAVMTTMNYHMGELRKAIDAKQCNAPAIAHHLQRPLSTTAVIVPVFPIDENRSPRPQPSCRAGCNRRGKRRRALAPTWSR